MPIDSVQNAPDTSVQPWVIKPLILRHAEDAAFYWAQRSNNVHSPLLRFDRLRHFDRLLAAHLDGLRVAGDVGWESALKNLQRWKGAGEAFAAYVLAIEAGDKMLLQALWEVVEKNPDVMQEGLISALGWVAEETAVPWMDFWLPLTNFPRLQQIALRAFALRRIEPDIALNVFFDSPDAAVREAACTLVGSVKLNKYAMLLQAARKDPTPEVREAVEIALLLLGHGGKVLQDLSQALLHWNGIAKDSKGWTRSMANQRTEMLARYIGHALPIADSGLSEIIETMSARQTLIALAHRGDPAAMRWIIDAMSRKDLARLAGWAFTMITGADLDRQRISTQAPLPDENEDERTVPLNDPDVGLSWPHPALVDAWWREHGNRYANGTRLLLGQAVNNKEHCLDILMHGAQAARWSAALNLATTGIDFPYVEINAPAKAQADEMNRLLADA